MTQFKNEKYSNKPQHNNRSLNLPLDLVCSKFRPGIEKYAWNENQYKIQIIPTALGFKQILQPPQTTLCRTASNKSSPSQATCI